MTFTEVADRVWVARYEWFDVNVTLVGGDRGLLVVDTHASAAAAATVVDDVRHLGAGDVVGIVNTHEHFDHTFGNGTVRAAGGVPIHAHETAAERLVAAGERIRRPTPPTPTTRTATRCCGPVPADRTFSSALALTLGDRLVELVHPAAATRAATSWCACPTQTCCSPATSWRSPSRRRTARTAGRWTGRSPSTWCWA